MIRLSEVFRGKFESLVVNTNFTQELDSGGVVFGISTNEVNEYIKRQRNGSGASWLFEDW